MATRPGDSGEAPDYSLNDWPLGNVCLIRNSHVGGDGGAGYGDAHRRFRNGVKE